MERQGGSAVSRMRKGRGFLSGCFFFKTPSSNFVLVISTRGPPDISSLVPVGPKYTMKWSAPLQQVQVVEVGQEGSQNKDTFFQQSGVKRPSSVCTSGKNKEMWTAPISFLSPMCHPVVNLITWTGFLVLAPYSDSARLICFCSQASRGGLEMHPCCLSFWLRMCLWGG